MLLLIFYISSHKTLDSLEQNCNLEMGLGYDDDDEERIFIRYIFIENILDPENMVLRPRLPQQLLQLGVIISGKIIYFLRTMYKS